MTAIDEGAIEQTALGWLEALGYEVAHGLEFAMVLLGRLHSALAQINPDPPAVALE